MPVIDCDTRDGIAVEHRHQCSGWRPQATYMDSMRGVVDISSPEHDLPASRGSCNVHLSWQQQRTGLKSMMTVCSSSLNLAAMLLICSRATPCQCQSMESLQTVLQAQHWARLLAAAACPGAGLRGSWGGCALADVLLSPALGGPAGHPGLL